MSSHLWPINVAQFGAGSEKLELLFYQGRLQLNSANANYSYGNLQTAFERLFNEVEIPWTDVKKSLVLGFGLGGVCDLMHKRNPEMNITGVEVNKQVVVWHREYFDRRNVNLVETDALHYLSHTEPKNFDLIIVDLYQDLDVPNQFQTKKFVSSLSASLNTKGIVIFNQVVSNEGQKQEFAELLGFFSSEFQEIEVNHQMEINRFIVSKRP